MSWLDALHYDARGLVPVVAQDVDTGEVLMLAYASREALDLSLRSGRAHYWSRSRAELWCKGERSGHTQALVEIRPDCDGDAVLYRVRQTGPACHTLNRSCFHRRVEGDAFAPADGTAHILHRIAEVVRQRHDERPEGSYTGYLFDAGLDKILKKLGEETTEIVIAAKNHAAAARDADAEAESALSGEFADLLYHLLVLLRERGVPPERIWAELDARFGAPPRARPNARPEP